MFGSESGQSISNLPLIKNGSSYSRLFLLDTLHSFTKLLSLHEKHTYILICYRFQTYCNMKKYIYCKFGSSYYIFIFKKISLIYSINSSFMGKEKVTIFHAYFFKLQRLIYVYMFPFFQHCKRTAWSAISNLTQNCVVWSTHFQGFL